MNSELYGKFTSSGELPVWVQTRVKGDKKIVTRPEIRSVSRNFGIFKQKGGENCRDNTYSPSLRSLRNLLAVVNCPCGRLTGYKWTKRLSLGLSSGLWQEILELKCEKEIHSVCEWGV